MGNIYIPTFDINIREIYELVNIVMEQQSGSPDFGYEMVVQMIPQLAMFVSIDAKLETCNDSTDSKRIAVAGLLERCCGL